MKENIKIPIMFLSDYSFSDFIGFISQNPVLTFFIWTPPVIIVWRISSSALCLVSTIFVLTLTQMSAPPTQTMCKLISPSSCGCIPPLPTILWTWWCLRTPRHARSGWRLKPSSTPTSWVTPFKWLSLQVNGTIWLVRVEEGFDLRLDWAQGGVLGHHYVHQIVGEGAV